jgi:hypothetical protein
MSDYEHGRRAAQSGQFRCLGCDPDGTLHPEWYRGYDDARAEMRATGAKA